jgi:hypothetical protein
MDARAPRVIIREWSIWSEPMTALRWGGRSLRPVSDAELDEFEHGGHVDVPLSAVFTCSVANEGSVTARVDLPANVDLDPDEGSIDSRFVFLAPGDVRSVTARVDSSLGEWLAAADEHVPVIQSFSLLVSDGFDDGVRDVLRITVKAYLVVRNSGEAPGLSGTIEARLASDLETAVEIYPIVRQYDHSEVW